MGKDCLKRDLNNSQAADDKASTAHNDIDTPMPCYSNHEN